MDETPTVASKVPINPETAPGKSPLDVAAAAQPRDATQGNAFDPFDRGLAEAIAGKEAAQPPPPATPPPTSPPAPVPAPPKPEQAPAFDPDKLPPDFRPKAEHWKTVNAERTRLREEVAALKKQMEDLGDIQTLKGLAAEKAELEKQLRLVAADRDPEFQKQYDSNRKSLLEEATAAVPADVSSQVESILKRHGAASAPYLREFIKEHELDAFSQSQLASVVAGLRTLEANRERLVRESAENWNKLTTEARLTAQRRAEEQQRQLDAILNDRLAVAQKENILFQARDDADKPEVEEAVALAKRVAGGDLDLEERANVALCTAAYPRLVKAYQRLHEEHAKLRATAEGLRGVQPGSGGPGKVGDEGEVEEVPKVGGRGNDAGDILMRKMRKMGL